MKSRMDSWGFASDESLSNAMNWELKALGNNTGLFPNDVNSDHQVFVEMGLRDSLVNPVTDATQNSFSEFDLKLCRVIDQTQTLNASKIAHSLSPEVSMPSKRQQLASFGSSTPCCQVHGCNKNLSSCKDYHKRHKVCEAHSKTAMVIVNGIEQRFCQQCSRFHLLGEFDDGKRSCRKRLAGHNERRRKPHMGVVSGRRERFLPSYNIVVEGNEFKASTGAVSSFSLPNALYSPYQPKHETNARWQMNLEDQTPHDLQSISSITDEQPHSQSRSPCNFEKNPRFNGIINGYIGASNPASMASSSRSAHSLLSSQSPTTSCYSSRIHTSNSHPLFFPGGNYEQIQDSGVMYDINQMLVSEGSLVKFGGDQTFRGSKHANSEDRVFPDDGRTIDLLQLSSQLERVERQKQGSCVNGVFVGLGIS